MTHELAYERLPDLLFDRDDPELLAHVGGCHRCQRQLFLLSRVDHLLRQRRPRARRRLPLALAMAALLAATAFVALPRRQSAAPARFLLRTDAGSVVARAQVQRGDAENDSLAFVANGLPTRPSDTYLLWTQGPDDDGPVIVGRFMVSHRGECRARFNLPGTRHSGRFWITPPTEATAIVAST